MQKQKTENDVTELLKTLISVIEEKDPYMKEHAERVAANCVLFARQMGLSQKEINQIYLAGLFHDIGMIYIPSDIVQKTEELTEEEMDLVKKHPLISEKILSKYLILKDILPIIRHHHESVDGSGYPDGLKGEEIPIQARIINLVSSFDSMTSARAHKPSMSIDDALKEIDNHSGNRFDSELAKDFTAFIRASKTVSQTIKEDENKEVEERQDEVEEEDAGTVRNMLQTYVKRVKTGKISLPLLPNVVREIQKVMSNPNTPVNELAGVIEKDAVISVRLIFAANSPIYRGTEKIMAVRQAIPRLGMKETQSIVSIIANKSLYQAKDAQLKTLMEKLWLHSLATAYLSRAIAKRLMIQDPEQFFFMGLVHDIGKVLLFKALGDVQTPLDMDEVMENVQDMHTGFGGVILRYWGFAENLTRITLLHEGPNLSTTTDQEILIVNAANIISRKIGYSLFQDKDMDLSAIESANLLQMTPEGIEEIAEETKTLMEDTVHIF